MQYLALLSVACSAIVIGVEAAVHGLHADHSGLARRMSGDVNLQKRGAGSRWSFYNTETGNA